MNRALTPARLVGAVAIGAGGLAGAGVASASIISHSGATGHARLDVAAAHQGARHPARVARVETPRTATAIASLLRQAYDGTAKAVDQEFTLSYRRAASADGAPSAPPAATPPAASSTSSSSGATSSSGAPTPAPPAPPSTATASTGGSGASSGGGSTTGGGASGNAGTGGAGGGSAAGQTTSPPPTSTAPATTASAATTGSGGAVTAGDSKTNCIYTAQGGNGYQSALPAVQQATGVSYDCLSVYADNATSWSGWESPWVDDPSTGYPGFAASANHTVIVGIQLAPRSVTAPSGSPDPAAWEASCASGSYNGYAKTLAGNLVSAGLGRAVIRLGIEMNGNWEADYAGTTAGEQQAWARCFAQEVSAMRSVSGADFLFDWNVNACVDDDNLSNLYPGNASVDIVGVDAYDAFCNGTHPAPSAATFQSLASEPDGLDAVTSFAASHGKPVSLPEWGTAAIPANGGSGLGDDGAYVKGIGQWVASNDVAFQTYFDIGDGSILPLTSANPNTLAAYRAAFG